MISILRRTHLHNGTKRSWSFHFNIRKCYYMLVIWIYVLSQFKVSFSVCYVILRWQHVRGWCNMSKWLNSLAVCHKYDTAPRIRDQHRLLLTHVGHTRGISLESGDTPSSRSKQLNCFLESPERPYRVVDHYFPKTTFQMADYKTAP